MNLCAVLDLSRARVDALHGMWSTPTSPAFPRTKEGWKLNEDVEWFTSSYSDGGQCVEIGHTERGTLIRDSKGPKGIKLNFTPEEWSALVTVSAMRWI